jgi:hypothetical protein
MEVAAVAEVARLILPKLKKPAFVKTTAGKGG